MPDVVTMLFCAVAVVVAAVPVTLLFQHLLHRMREKVIAQHLPELAITRNRLLPPERLGLVDRKKWERTQRDFLRGRFELSGRREHAGAVAAAMASMDAQIDRYLESGGDRDARAGASADLDGQVPAALGAPAHGLVYLLSNPAMPGLVKIGMTSRDIASRLRELNAPTSVPSPFAVVFHVAVSDCGAAERHVHHVLAAHRSNHRREFFQVDTTVAIEAMLQARERFPA